MADEEETSVSEVSQAFVDQLTETGFFKQINDLESNLRTIAEDLKVLGQTATQRLQETESLAAHVLAIEAILAVVLKASPVNAVDVSAAISEKTSGMTDSGEGSSAVQGVAAEILAKAHE
jgi:hypothetical protein